MFGRIHNMHKMGRPRDASRCFCCFSHKLSATDISFSAEMLGRRRFGDLKNSETARCSAAVFRCFVIQMQELQRWQYRVDRSHLHPMFDEIPRMTGDDIRSSPNCQLTNVFLACPGIAIVRCRCGCVLIHPSGPRDSSSGCSARMLGDGRPCTRPWFLRHLIDYYLPVLVTPHQAPRSAWIY